MTTRTLLKFLTFSLALSFWAAEVEAQGSFGFYRLPNDCWYDMDAEVEARLYTTDPPFHVKDTDTYSGHDPGNVYVFAAVGDETTTTYASTEYSMQCTVAPDGGDAAQVDSDHEYRMIDKGGLTDTDIYHTEDNSTTICELRGSGLPTDTTFTINAELKIDYVDDLGSDFTRSGHWTLSTESGVSSLQVTISYPFLYIEYPDRSVEYRMMSAEVVHETITCTLSSDAQLGEKVHIDAGVGVKGAVSKNENTLDTGEGGTASWTGTITAVKK